MALSAELAALDEAHRAQQASNASAVAQAVLAYWLLVDPEDVSGSGRQWLDRSVEAVLRGRERSAQFAGAYSIASRQIQTGRRDTALPPAPEVNVEQIRNSLAFTGLGNAVAKVQAAQRVAGVQPSEAGEKVSRTIAAIYRRQTQIVRATGVDAEQLLRERALDRAIRDLMTAAGAAAAAAAVRHTQNGGRGLVKNLSEQRVAVGYVRITQANPCYFCAMLASRGPVYRDVSFSESDPRFEGDGDAKVHDDCGCTLRPLYSFSKDQWPDRSREFERMWTDMEGDREKWRPLGLNSITAFRQVFEGRISWE